VSGFSCPDGDDLNGHYEYVAMTSDGRPIYASASSTHYLFYDASCGDGSDAPWSSGWFVDSAFPNSLAWSPAPTMHRGQRRLGTAMDDSSIRDAVAAWLSDETAAEATYGHISTWETSGVTDMAMLFCRLGASISSSPCVLPESSYFNDDISAWDTSAVTSMYYMMYNQPQFNININSWDTGAVVTMERMFDFCTSYNQPLNGWDVSSVTSIKYMFINTAFDQPLADWTTSAIVNMEGTFRNAPFNQELDDWDVSAVLTTRSMFSGWSKFNKNIGTWDLYAVTDMSRMFRDNSDFDHPGRL